MRYLHFFIWSPLNTVGGNETILRSTVKEQIKKGHTVFVIGRKEGKKGIKKSIVNGVTYIEVCRPIKPCPSSLQVGIIGMSKLLIEIAHSNLLLDLHVLNIVRQEKIDAVVFYGIHTVFISPVIRLFGAITLLAFGSVQRHHTISKISFLYWIRKLLYASFSGILTLNKSFYLSDGTRINSFYLLQKLTSKKNIFFLPWGIPVSEVEKVKENKEFLLLKKSKKEQLIVCPRRLVEEKGVRYLMQAIPLVLEKEPKAFFVFTSAGVLRSELDALVVKMGLQQHVFFTGLIPYKMTLSIIKSADVMVAPSSGEELFGMVFLESYALKTPIVSTFFGGIPDVVINNKTGLLVKPKDSKGLANAILQILKNKRSSKQLAANGYRRLREKYQLYQTINHLDRIVTYLKKN